MAQDTVGTQDTVAAKAKLATGLVAAAITGWTEWHYGLAKAAALTQKSSSVFLLGFQSFAVKYVTQHPKGTSAYMLLLGIMFCVGYKMAALFGSPLSILRTLFRRIDESAIKPIPPVRAWDPLWGPGHPEDKNDPDPPLDWVEPKEDSARYVPYRGLITFAAKGISAGRHTPFGKSKPDDLKHPFLFTFLVGRSGSGKTRMAVEFMRDKLAQRKRMTTLQEKHPLKYRFERLGQWWRHVAPRVTRRDTDPWDIGWLHVEKEGAVREYEDRQNIVELVDGLKTWIPRRPTALLFDDPVAGEEECIGLVQTLMEQSKNFRYPVRLLIVSQWTPEKLVDSTYPLFHDPVLMLDEGCWFTLDDVAYLLKQSIEHERKRGHRLDMWVNDPDQYKERAEVIWKICDEGNPMLVEIALRWIWRNRPISEMTPEVLIRDRAERIRKTFQRLKADEKLIASCTLARHAPLTKEQEREVRRQNRKLRPELGKKLEGNKTLFGQIYSVNKILGADNMSTIPVVRPQLVADAFVRLVADEAPYGVVDIVADGWELSPEGMLASIGRLAAYEDNLGVALRAAPPDEAAVDPVVYAVALTRAGGMRTLYAPWAFSLIAIKIAVERVQAMQPEQTRAFLESLLGAKGLWHTGQKNSGVEIRALTFIALIALTKVIDSADQASPLELTKLVPSILSMKPLVHARLCQFVQPRKEEGEAGKNACGAICKVAKSLPATQASSTNSLLVLAAEIGAISWFDPFHKDVDALVSLRNGSNLSAEDFLLHVQAEVAFCILHVREFELCKAKAEMVEMLTTPFLGKDEGLSLAWALSQNCMCYIYSCSIKDIELCIMVADKLRSVIGVQQPNSSLAYILANSLAHLCFACGYHPHKLTECIKAADDVTEIAERRQLDTEFDVIRLRAQKNLSYAYSLHLDKLSECEMAAGIVMKLAESKQSDVSFVLITAQTQKDLCEAYAKRSGKLTECMRAARKVSDIVMSAQDNANLAFELVSSQKHLCFAYLNARRWDDCISTAEKVIEFAKPWSQDKTWSTAFAREVVDAQKALNIAQQSKISLTPAIICDV